MIETERAECCIYNERGELQTVLSECSGGSGMNGDLVSVEDLKPGDSVNLLTLVYRVAHVARFWPGNSQRKGYIVLEVLRGIEMPESPVEHAQLVTVYRGERWNRVNHAPPSR